MNSWFFKYKVYHIPFWVIYHILWWTVSVGSFTKVWAELAGTPYLFKTLFYIVFQALGVYFNLYFLIPGLLEKQKYYLYVAGFVLTTLATAALIVPGYFLSAELWGKPMNALYGAGADTFWHFFRHLTLPSSFAAMTLGMSVKLAKQWILAKQREQKLEKEKLETELKFLKSQLNPHFLFNTINTLFILIDKDREAASSSLLRFSGLLRYQLYECNDTYISLGNELEYMQNYIALEKLRHEKSLDLRVDLPEIIPGSSKIAPFILMPFIENAFKHSSKGSRAFIHISVSLNSNELYLGVKNSTDPFLTGKAPGNTGGIGLQNVCRRLDLLYPEKYELKRENVNDVHAVLLKIML